MVNHVRNKGSPSPSFSLYRIVVFPAASSPTMRMRISFFPNCSKKKETRKSQIHKKTGQNFLNFINEAKKYKEALSRFGIEYSHKGLFVAYKKQLIYLASTTILTMRSHNLENAIPILKPLVF
mmetsp:Transcript_33655/g.77664  ORF Transcript_33655/g.77664 Transcript_33655/m.77664 type:complete len:123 (-) Transcript_33655:273-641(-)